MFNTLPSDPMILVSVVNTKLRDTYSSIDSLCDDLDVDKDELIGKLNKVNYKYNAEKNQFI
ncbi:MULTISPECIES: DUF4250 domain-containing protein [Eubacterium]|uniref:DUF4250 domain-containing protein n=1 Tax=Eubacterium uniforme TaxID=39495 RepID=A0A1T4VSV7_9FIRM|nr:MULTISPECIES: DUF4250 domain-containing protein [Eubacterium]MCR5629867.1 DUF4250 domain-containing protein [Eubacterium sp.]SKA68053.1 protein of unknown function [Eubacterium uniforme]